MPIIKDIAYKPPLPFRSGHINTIYPFVFRKGVDPLYERERFETNDDDFIDLDKIINGNKKAAILCHGLEGSSDSQYIVYLSQFLSQNGWDVIAMNHRSCSGEMNRKLKMYHSGFTSDLHEVVQDIEGNYDELALIGFSLGGNIILKYTNDDMLPQSDKIKAIVGVSVPVDLSSSGVRISTRENILYQKNFLQSLMRKIKLKQQKYPDDISISDITKVKTLTDFDDIFTGPIHGFEDGQDYYTRCSSKPHLRKVNKPTLLINAMDDPFLDEESLPYDIAEETDLLFFMAPKFGGHVGFTTFGNTFYWHEHKILEFINEPNIYNH